MKPLILLILSVILTFALFPEVSSIFIEGNNRDRFSNSFSDSSSHEHGSRRRKNHYNVGPSRPRPPRPAPPPPATPPPPARCPTGWLTFNRPQGTWCIQVFFGAMTQWDAEQQCQSRGATLTGLQDANERLQVTARGRQNLLNLGVNANDDGSIRLGAARIGMTPSYRWTDGHTTGLDGLTWGTLEPTMGFRGSEPESCLILICYTSTTFSTNIYWRTLQHGVIADAVCSVYHGTEMGPNQYACGRKP